ncbi:hypothetical protein [Nonomuraea sp. 160415]|nr:hypothetical protein EJK15_47425 [Nonomuraea basaltis]
MDRWIRDWRAGGFEALLPAARHTDPRSDRARRAVRKSSSASVTIRW